ncbi:PGN_0703 family putative restriction endonuclease [uncultured Draconibacterium sp.]|uniref:PGN_0703 family putative restriction endonuclease n=1 Tax=uncultured Draconibacterium sp. TaxID=1573823 RepID=UPI0032602C57
MITETINGKDYRLPGSLTAFQKAMYIHLINYKWENLGIKEPGTYRYKGEDILYDAILPKYVHQRFPIIYPSILETLLRHQKRFLFKLHKHFNHMASSQVANVNLFLPLLLSPKKNEIFRQLKPDLKRLETGELDNGFQIEYWDGVGNEKGLLGDHNARSGTDSDIAIAYRNKNDELCLWLIEHKLTEKEFTTCGASKSNNRDEARHDCSLSFSEILKNKSKCYYHDIRKNNYWNITEKHQAFFLNHKQYEQCPFIGGMNQLWRNQLMALALEDEGRFKHVYFSVVHHPDNKALNASMNAYKALVNNNPKFSVFTSNNVVDIAKKQNDESINNWVKWYVELYKINS